MMLTPPIPVLTYSIIWIISIELFYLKMYSFTHYKSMIPPFTNTYLHSLSAYLSVIYFTIAKENVLTWVRPVDMFGEFPRASDQRLCCHHYRTKKDKVISRFGKHTEIHWWFGETTNGCCELALWWVTGFNCHCITTQPVCVKSYRVHPTHILWFHVHICIIWSNILLFRI